jgi:hypothetical protein
MATSGGGASMVPCAPDGALGSARGGSRWPDHVSPRLGGSCSASDIKGLLGGPGKAA